MNHTNESDHDHHDFHHEDSVTIARINIFLIVASMWLAISFIIHGIDKKLFNKGTNTTSLIFLATVGPLLSVIMLIVFHYAIYVKERSDEPEPVKYLVLSIIVIELAIFETFRCHLFLWLRQKFLYETNLFAESNSKLVRRLGCFCLVIISICFAIAFTFFFFTHFRCSADSCDVTAQHDPKMMRIRSYFIVFWNLFAHISLFMLFFLPTNRQRLKNARKNNKKVENQQQNNNHQDDTLNRAITAKKWSRLVKWCFARFSCCILAVVVLAVFTFWADYGHGIVTITIYNGYLIVNEWSTLLAYDNCLRIVLGPLIKLKDLFCGMRQKC